MFGRTYKPEYSQYGIMSSILDQYEETAKVFSVPSAKPGVIADLEDETPMFSKRRVDFFPSDNITHLCVCADVIIVAMENNVLHRINIRQPDKPSEIDLTKFGNVRISGLYLSPNGLHALISLVGNSPEFQPQLLYLSRNSIKLKPLIKFKGIKVTAVAWSTWPIIGNTSGPILIGSMKGVLYETEVSGDSDGFFNISAPECNQVFDIGRGSECPVKSLNMFRSGDRYHILATTLDKIYHYVSVVNSDEKNLFGCIFRKYLSAQERCETVINETRISKLDVFCPRDSDGPRQFSWLVGRNVFYGKIPDDDSLLLKSEAIPCSNGQPHDLLLTAFHVLLVYTTHVSVVSLLTHRVVFEDIFPTDLESDLHGQPKRIIREPTRGSIYVYTDRTVFSYKIRREDRDVWKDYMEHGDFDKARDLCHGNQIYLDRVTTRQADVLFDECDYKLSAYYYSQSASISFEEVALKFLRSNQIGPLMRFLNLRLDGLKQEDSMQRTMLVVWLVELYLSRLGKSAKESVEHDQLQSDLDALLASQPVKECVMKNKGTIYDLMASHGDTVNFIKLSLTHLDYERVIRQHIYKGDYLEALGVLKKTLNTRKELIYTFAASLINHIPDQLLGFFTQNSSKLSPTKLLPALALTYDAPVAARLVAQYLQHCVDILGCKDRSLHNLLLSIYVKHQPDRLRVYLLQQGQDAESVCYDVHFALRLCQEEGQTEACVQLSALLGLWSSAVELALTVNVALAEQTANQQRSDPDLLKSLWLKIAEHVVKKKHDIKAAMAFLKKCPLLKIEDILPFFPDFVTIDDFKEAICKSLQEYNQHIQDLKDEMNESTKSVDMIVQEMSAFKNRHMVITWSDTCSACELKLLLRAFYIFPCSHHFHTDCLKETMQPILSPATRQRLAELQRELVTVGGDDVSTSLSVTTARGLVHSRIDSILAGECPLCGDTMVESIDLPFVPDRDFDQVLKEWE